MNSTSDLPEPVQPPGLTGAYVYAPITNIIHNAPPTGAPENPVINEGRWRVVAGVCVGLILLGIVIGAALAGSPLTIIVPL